MELACGHAFHRACITEWLSKDGRCPVCRAVIDSSVVQRSEAARAADSPAAVGSDTIDLLVDSRRLMMFAIMETALAVLLMSYLADLLSSAMMLLAAFITFYSASAFLKKGVAMCRPVIGFNLVYHLYSLIQLIHDGPYLFAAESATTRAAFLSLACVVVMEAAALKRCGLFYLKLLACRPADLARLQRLRLAHAGGLQRAVISGMFILMCVPLIAKYLCRAAVSSSSEACFG